MKDKPDRTRPYEALDLPLLEGVEGMTGSSDIGNVDYHCPAFHPVMSIGKDYQCHTVEFAEEMTKPNTHQAIQNAAALYCNPDRMHQIKQEHKEYRGL